MRIIKDLIILVTTLIACLNISVAQVQKIRSRTDFGKGWMFSLGEINNAQDQESDDSKWRKLNLPHDWSIEGEFSERNPATFNGGALPGGVGWYRKSFTIPETEKNKTFFIDFDGVYYNSEVWINGHYLGKRPYGYSSFRYELSPFLNFGNKKNVIAVKVDNSKQPNSRWYSGSGIYRNVWLVTTDNIFIDHWGTFVSTPQVSDQVAKVSISTKIRRKTQKEQAINLNTIIYSADGKEVGRVSSNAMLKDTVTELKQELTIKQPKLWSDKNPYLYKSISQVVQEGKVKDSYETPFGVRYFAFDSEKGFLLNGKRTKINGVCNHHDLGCLGAAINVRGMERQLEILKNMGCNGIRTSHNPPAPELLDLCDKMGFIVMDEAFDIWKKKKTDFDYHLYWDEWHKRDLEDMVLRDRNHPSLFMYSIGNEINEQWDSTGTFITKELTSIIRNLDATRAITSGCNWPNQWNRIHLSGALDLVGYNYHHIEFKDFNKKFPGQKFIGTETVSALATRGHYDMPSDSVRMWPIKWDEVFTKGNPDWSCSAYDNCAAPWGATHEETWKLIKKYDFLSGMYIWTGFDYLGEPTPYAWPARSSYFGIIDLCGFPKDVYYMYQSEWTDKPVLHIFPHWNWKEGQIVDVWAYFNSDEVELFLNGKSLGTKKKTGDDLHVMWRIPYVPGTLKAISRKNGKIVLAKEVRTAGKPAKIILIPDRSTIKGDGKDLSYVTVKIVDKDGNLVPDADNLVNFKLEGEGIIAGTDNGSPVSHESFKTNQRKAFNGLGLAVIQSKEKAGKITLSASGEGLESSAIVILVK